jgi:hypothetical protein
MLRKYLARRRSSVKPDSALEHGLSYRLLKELVNAGDHSTAMLTFSDLATSIARSYGIDLERPGALVIGGVSSTFDEFAASYPMCLAGIAYFRGLIALNYEQSRESAARYFSLAERYGTALLQQLAKIGAADAEMVELVERSKMLRLRAVAYTAPAEAASDALRLIEERQIPAARRSAEDGIAALCVHLVDLGALGAAESLFPVASLVAVDRSRPARLRASVYRALALVALNKNRAARKAACLFRLAERAIREWLTEQACCPDAFGALWRVRYEQMFAFVVAADARRALRIARKFVLTSAERRLIPPDILNDADVIIHRLTDPQATGTLR